VGTGGFDGFLGTATVFCGWHRGGHGSALEGAENLSRLTLVALSSIKPYCPEGKDTVEWAKRDPSKMRMISRAMPWAMPFLAGGAIYGATKIPSYVDPRNDHFVLHASLVTGLGVIVMTVLDSF
jgi:hypothetical protein